MKRLLAILAVLIIFGFGCSHPRAWTYKADPFIKATPVLNKSVAVPPFADQRPSENGNYILTYLIPLMPYGWQDFNTPESVQMHCNSGLWTFRPNEDFAKAVAEELNNTSLFKEVFFTYKTSDADLILRGRINSTKYDCKVISYFLSIWGPLLWFIGFPASYVENQLFLSFQLVDQRTDEIIWERSFSKLQGKISLIYSLQSDFLYDSFLKEMMKEAIPEIRTKLIVYQGKK